MPSVGAIVAVHAAATQPILIGVGVASDASRRRRRSAVCADARSRPCSPQDLLVVRRVEAEEVDEHPKALAVWHGAADC